MSSASARLPASSGRPRFQRRSTAPAAEAELPFAVDAAVEPPAAVSTEVPPPPAESAEAFEEAAAAAAPAEVFGPDSRSVIQPLVAAEAITPASVAEVPVEATLESADAEPAAWLVPAPVGAPEVATLREEPEARPPATLTLARLYIQQQQLPDAVEVLERLRRADPDNQEAADLLELVRDMLEPLDEPLPPLSVRERKIAALQRFLACLTLGRDRAQA